MDPKRAQKGDLLLAIDNGTQSLRALIFDAQGQLLAKSTSTLEPYVSPEPGWAEQDAEYYWQKLCETCQALLKAHPDLRPRLRGVALSCQRATVINLDRDGNPLRPAIVWLDRRVADDLPPLGAWAPLIALSGKSRALRDAQMKARSNWIRQHQPEIWAKTHKYLSLSGFHNFRLTGQYRDAVSSQVGYLPFQFPKRAWASAKSWEWPAYGLRREMLPDLVEAGAPIGEITAKAAAATGLPQGLPVIAAGSDKACEVLGSNSLDPATGSISYGTTATFNAVTPKFAQQSPSRPAYPAAMPGAFNLEFMVERGFWMVSWFKNEFAHHELHRAESENISPYALLNDLLRSVPPGSMGLVLQPYWTSSSAESDQNAKGAIIGFGEVHTRAHFYRAMIEGIVYALHVGQMRLEKITGSAMQRIRISGGGSQSDEIMQISADVFGKPCERLHTFETAGLGAAINVAVGTGLYSSHASAADAMVHVSQRFEPNPHNHHIYTQLHGRVYAKMYSRLAPLYHEIKRIIRYPAD
ncbi:MAG: FGGY-family carbohydrate kinase [Mangrovicoccus sp.]|nr:FGGY-family carbohydrate kinase [Mangrovicoccus sp.]